MLPASADAVSPSGGSEIRNLPSFAEGEFAHATTLGSTASEPARLSGMGELFHVLGGTGELWRSTGELEDITQLVPARCVSIPPGIDYQYRPVDAPLSFIVVTAPRWRRENWHAGSTRRWAEDGTVASDVPLRPGPWATLDLPPEYDYLAPDGSEIRLLLGYDAGGLAHCRLPPHATSAAVRHRTVVEVWYVLSGRGEIWRASDDAEETVEASAGLVATIPTGTKFQFRTDSEALEILIGTFPRWPGAAEAEPVNGPWAASSIKAAKSLS